MKNTRLISLTLALALSTGLLTGCGEQTQAHVSGNEDMIVVTDREQYLASNDGQNTETDKTQDVTKIEGYQVAPEEKEYEPYEHLFMIRYDFMEELGYANARMIDRASIVIPDGYEILELESFSSLGGKIGTNQTYGVDVWFINTEPVLVKPVYNEAFKQYDYSQPGTVIELEVEESNKLIK